MEKSTQRYRFAVEISGTELQAMPPETREKILALEKPGLYGKGKDYEKNRYPEDYMKTAWGEGYFPYLYQNHPDPKYDPLEDGKISWDLYREMRGVTRRICH